MSHLHVTTPSCRENLSSGFSTRSDTHRAVQPEQMARGLKFRIKKEEELCNLCSENKGADQLCGHRTADLCLCFRICKKEVFSLSGSLRKATVTWTSFYVIISRLITSLGKSSRQSEEPNKNSVGIFEYILASMLKVFLNL